MDSKEKSKATTEATRALRSSSQSSTLTPRKMTKRPKIKGPKGEWKEQPMRAKVVIQKGSHFVPKPATCSPNPKAPLHLLNKDIYSWQGKEQALFSKMMNERAQETQHWVASRLERSVETDEKEERHFQMDRVIRYLTDIASPG